MLLPIACSDPGSGTGDSSSGSPSSSGPGDTSSSDGGTTVDPTTGPATETTPGTTTGSTTDESSTGGSSGTTVADSTGSGSSSSGGESSTGELLDYDCENLVQPFVSEVEIDGARGYHDVYFDGDGHIIGYDGASSLVQATYDGNVSVFLPGLGSTPQGMDTLVGGDLLLVDDNGELRRVSPDAQSSLVAANFFGAYGVTIGPDEFAYVGFGDTIAKVDPETGDWTEFVNLNGVSARVVEFNLDSTMVYISTIASGDVYVVPVDAELEATAEPEVFASGVGDSWHDGLTMDACGNLYVPEFWTSGLYRIDPEGVVTTVYDQNSSGFEHYGHGLEWGSGIDGWNDHAVYLPQPYNGNTVNEVVLGVPSASTVRTWDP
jgi:SMP-30/Gluconolactonase/LRE-like region